MATLRAFFVPSSRFYLSMRTRARKADTVYSKILSAAGCRILTGPAEKGRFEREQPAPVGSAVQGFIICCALIAFWLLIMSSVLLKFCVLSMS